MHGKEGLSHIFVHQNGWGNSRTKTRLQKHRAVSTKLANTFYEEVRGADHVQERDESEHGQTKKDTQNIFRFLGERPLPIQYSRRNQKNGEDREENGGTRRRDTHSSDAPQESLSCRRKLCVPSEQMEHAINDWNAYHQDETEGAEPLSFRRDASIVGGDPNGVTK